MPEATPEFKQQWFSLTGTIGTLKSPVILLIMISQV